MLLTLKLLFLLLVANGTPILLRKALGTHGDWPVDFGLRFLDGRPLLGPSKTWRGLLAATLLTGMTATALGLSFELGLGFGAAAMLGDLASSFFKRRIALPSSSMALGLDQIPEALLPLLTVQAELALETGYILWVVAVFLLLELVLSRILFALHIREHPQ